MVDADLASSLEWFMKTSKPLFRLRRGAVSFAMGAGIFVLSAFVEAMLHAFNINGAWEWVDNCVSAIVTGLIVFAYEQHLYKSNLARLRVIADMNHHVRNALQPFLYAGSIAMPQEQQTKIIRDSVNRIEWALSEVLPRELTAYPSAWRSKVEAPGDAA
jgi:hypothetical protein